MLAFGLLVSMLLCAPTAVTASPGDTVAACDPTQDIYFDNKLRFEYATTVRSIVYNNTFVTVGLQWTDYYGPGSANYVFVRRGCPSPQLGPSYTEILVPALSAFAQQTVTVPKIVLLGQRHKLAAVEDGGLVTTKEIVHDLRAGLVKSLSAGWPYNYTLLPLLAPAGLPDVLLMGTAPIGASDGWTPAMQAISFIDTDSGESTPLGRAELLKLQGLIFGATKTAQAIFDSIVVNYQAAIRVAAVAKRRPSVMHSVPYGGFWSVASGNSYWGAFLRDAGADYRFAASNVSVSSVAPAAFEREFGQAQIWLNALFYSYTGTKQTMDDLVAGNNSLSLDGDAGHFSRFLAFQCGQVWANDNRIDAAVSTGNPFFEEGAVRPDLVLLDLVMILHPEAFPDAAKSLYFYRAVAPLTPTRRAQLNLPACPIASLPAWPAAANQVFLTSKFLVTGVSQPIFDQFHYTLVKPAFVAALQLGALDSFELFVAANQPPPSVLAAGPAFYVGVNVPVASAAPDLVLAVAERLRALGATTLRAAVSQVIAAWNTVLLSPPSTLSSLSASLLTAYKFDDPRVSVSEQGNLQMALFDRRVVDAPLPPTDSDSVTLTRGAVAGIALGSLVIAAALIAGVGRLCFRAGSKQAYERISQAARGGGDEDDNKRPRAAFGDNDDASNEADQQSADVSASKNDKVKAPAFVDIQMK